MIAEEDIIKKAKEILGTVDPSHKEVVVPVVYNESGLYIPSLNGNSWTDGCILYHVYFKRERAEWQVTNIDPLP